MKAFSHRHSTSVSSCAITNRSVLALLWPSWEGPGFKWEDGMGVPSGLSQVIVSLGSLGWAVSTGSKQSVVGCLRGAVPGGSLCEQ